MPTNTLPKFNATAAALIFALSVVATFSNGQPVTKSMLAKIQDRFKTYGNYTALATLASVNNRGDGLPPDMETACPSGKEMLVVAVFGTKPKHLFARMLVAKHFGKKTAYDEHLFQDATFEESLRIWYSLVQVQFPAQANSLNCGVNVQVFDKDSPKATVWLLTFSK